MNDPIHLALRYQPLDSMLKDEAVQQAVGVLLVRWTPERAYQILRGYRQFARFRRRLLPHKLLDTSFGLEPGDDPQLYPQLYPQSPELAIMLHDNEIVRNSGRRSDGISFLQRQPSLDVRERIVTPVDISMCFNEHGLWFQLLFMPYMATVFTAGTQHLPVDWLVDVLCNLRV